MSFIFEDSNLIEQLLVSGLQHELKFTKKGQAAASVADQNRATLLQHIKTLQDQLNPAGASKDPNAGPTISHNGAASLGSPQLESLGDLVQWLSNSETKIDGQVVAYPTKPADDSQYTLYKLETHTSTPQQRGQDPAGLWVNPNLLQKFIVSLQANETQNPNAIFQKQLSLIIRDANQELGLDIKPQYEVPEKVLPDTTVLDNLPHVINVKYPTQGGNIPLTYGDLKDDTSFNAWLSKNNIALDAGDEGGPVLINSPRFDFKKVIDAIIQRAQFFMTRATDVQSKERYNIYLRQSSTLGSQIGSGTSANRPQVGTPNQQGGQGNQQGGSASQAVQDAVQTLPFASRDINFDRIRDFFSKILQVMGSDTRITKIINDTMQLMTSINARMSIGDIFPLGVRPSDFAARFKNQQTPGADYYQILKDLSQVINNTRMVVEFFWSKNKQSLMAQQSYLIGQIGETPQDDSLYNQNAESLQDLYSAKHT
jgi:hypothetical protein